MQIFQSEHTDQALKNMMCERFLVGGEITKRRYFLLLEISPVSAILSKGRLLRKRLLGSISFF